MSEPELPLYVLEPQEPPTEFTWAFMHNGVAAITVHVGESTDGNVHISTAPGKAFLFNGVQIGPDGL
jgi:hypothetical protein